MELTRLVPPPHADGDHPNMAQFTAQLGAHIMPHISSARPVDVGRLASGIGALCVPTAGMWMSALVARMDTLVSVDIERHNRQTMIKKFADDYQEPFERAVRTRGKQRGQGFVRQAHVTASHT